EVAFMADFTAPLFVGDQFLWDCLNGQATMGDRPNRTPAESAPKESVTRVQTALQLIGFDLGQHGVDGLWGQDTYDAVVAFKTMLDIRTPNGVLDGYVGTRTMTALEEIFGMAAFDEAAAGIVDLGNRVGGQVDLGAGVVSVDYDNGVVVSANRLAAWPIP